MYSETAESFSYKTNPAEFNKVYSEIADETPLAESFKIRDLLDKLPTIDFYAKSTQSDIIRVVIRDMKHLPFGHDRLYKVRARYKWLFAPQR